jgi:N-acetylmuramoyl-L-alanine amidase
MSDYARYRSTRVPRPQVTGRRRLLALAGLGALVLIGLSAFGSSASGGQPVDPSRFSPGACVAYAPTTGDRHRTVFLDAGHGGPDPGSIGETQNGQRVEEAQLTLAVELDATALLRRHGFRVVVSRAKDTAVTRLTAADMSGGLLTAAGVHADVGARDVCANDAHANALVGIYFDAGSAGNAGSVTGYDAVRPFAAENLRLAELVQSDVLAALNAHGWQIPDEGVQTDTGLGSTTTSAGAAYGHLLLLGPAKPGWFSTPSRMPGALIEPLYITDPFEATIAASRTGQEVIAAGLARALESYFART